LQTVLEEKGRLKVVEDLFLLPHRFTKGIERWKLEGKRGKERRGEERAEQSRESSWPPFSNEDHIRATLLWEKGYGEAQTLVCPLALHLLARLHPPVR
jgi:hypothetical protein